MRLSVKESPELLATVLAIRSLDRTLQKTIRQHTKAVVAPAWQAALEERATTRLQRRALSSTSVVAVSNQNVTVKAGSKGRKLSGGFDPKVHKHAAEFGADKTKPTTYKRRNRGSGGGSHSVTRVVTTGLPDRRKGGYVFWPAAAEMTPRLASLWIQTVVRTIAEALEGKRE